MYNFFSNKLKLRAFKKALKELESEGLYVNLEANENTHPIVPDISKAVSELTYRDEKPLRAEAKTVDVTALAPNLDGETETDEIQESPKFLFDGTPSKQPLSASSLFGSMFQDSTLQTDTQQSKPEFLEKTGRQVVAIEEDKKESASLQDSKHRTFADLAARARARRESQNNSDNKQTQTNAEIKIPEIKPDIQMPEMQKEPESEPEPNKVVVEVVADIPKPQPPVTKTKTVTKTVVITKEVPAKPKAKRKPSTNKKKKRKYDADISGGFDF